LRPLLEPLKLGWHVTVSRVAWYAYSNADYAIVGRVLGKNALGTYGFAWQIASIPVDKVSAVVGRVTLPIFARVQDDYAAVRRYLRALIEGLALITFPLSFGLALVADDFVLLALGEPWRPAIVPLRLLALYAGFRSVTTLFPQVLVAIGRARWGMILSLLLAIVMPAAFLIGARWGTGGVATAWIIAYPLVVVPLLIVYTLRCIGETVRGYLGALWPATQATALMAASVLVADRFTPASWGHAVALACHTAIGATVYGLTVWIAHADRIRRFRALLASIRE
jgi:PST family polysaccharide transporter